METENKRRQVIHSCECSICEQHPYSRVAKEHRTINRLVAGADERHRRLLVGFLAQQRGRGGVALLARVTGLSRRTILRGRRELQHLYRTLKFPVISVDSKKKEWVGNFKNPGRTWRRVPWDVFDHDFPSWAIGRAIPYGIYDFAYNDGYIVVGTSHDTANFPVAAIRHWWFVVGRQRYPGTKRLLIQADAGGSNGYRSWEWKWALQQLADELGRILTVTHCPPGASKWNPIDHRILSLITANWAGEPLTSYERILKYIRTTRSETGFRCRASLDRRDYPTKVKVTPTQKSRIRLKPRPVLPQWNYTILPHANPHNRK
jgi:hypothetical protein